MGKHIVFDLDRKRRLAKWRRGSLTRAGRVGDPPPHNSSLRHAQWIVHLGMTGKLLVCPADADRKSTRLNSSHVAISYAVFCLKKKKDHDVVFLSRVVIF